MKCSNCEKIIYPGEEYMLKEKVVCEDCYMDANSPSKVCDPWGAKINKIPTQIYDPSQKKKTDKSKQV
jgi:hypothetical protein